MKNYPKITVVTVCYNALETIEETMLSVLNQTYSNIEYIVIDGGSTDGTVEIIKKYADRLFYWVSESDKGIYDAMNKGIKVATGEYINFMNAGDKFFSNDVLREVFASINATPGVIYGSTFMKYSFGNYIVEPDSLEKIVSRMIFCHQSVFMRSDLAKRHPFRDKYGLAADHGASLEIFNENPNTFFQYAGIIAEYDAKNGISSRNALRAYRHQSALTHSHDTLYRKFRIIVRTYFPYSLLIPLGRIYFGTKKRFKRVK